MDINLPDGTGDDDYLAILEKHLHQAFEDFAPQILFYVAGADPYREDQLGGLALTMEGLARRDALVFDYARQNGVPVAIALAGGYARHVEDTVRIHVGTILAARDAAGNRRGRERDVRAVGPMAAYTKLKLCACSAACCAPTKLGKAAGSKKCRQDAGAAELRELLEVDEDVDCATFGALPEEAADFFVVERQAGERLL